MKDMIGAGTLGWRSLLLLAVALQCASGIAVAQAVTTQRNDNQRSGAYRFEKLLNRGNVAPGSFGKLYSIRVDGQVAAQPLFVPGVSAGGPGAPPRDLLFIATRTNRIYAFDVGKAGVAGSPPMAWPPLVLVDPDGRGAQELPGMDRRFVGDNRRGGACLQTHGPVGINSTPVIDLASHTMWVVFRTASPFEQQRYDARFFIRKIDIRTGKTLGESMLKPSDPQFDPNKVLPRTALLLDRGKIYLGFGGAVCDDGGGDPNSATSAHGWVVALDADSLEIEATLNTTPRSKMGGIWQSGNGLAADPAGSIYGFTGNNEYLDPRTPVESELAEAALKLTLNVAGHAFAVEHYRVSNWANLDRGDVDLASGGPVVMPNGYVVGGGKQGRLYVFDPTRMSVPRQEFQAFFNTWHTGISSCDYDLAEASGPNIHGSPVVWHSDDVGATLLYAMPEKDYLKAFRFLDSATFTGTAPPPFSKVPFASTRESGFRSPRGMPGGVVSLSSEGGKNGILWVSSAAQDAADARNTSGQFPGRLAAFDAVTLERLWEAAEPVSFAKFVPVTIAGGKVFRVAYENEVVVYGLTGRPAIPSRTKVAPHRPVTALWRDADHLDVFTSSRDPSSGSVLSTNWEARCPNNADERSWRGWFPIVSGPDQASDNMRLPSDFQFRTAGSAPVTAVWRNHDHLDLFVTDGTGRVMSTYWQPTTAPDRPENKASGWQSWFPVGASTLTALAGQAVTAVWRNANHLDLFAVDRDGRVVSTFFENDAWQPGWFRVAGGGVQAAPGTRVTALWRTPDHLDLFVTDIGGHVMSTYFEQQRWQPGWFAVAPQSGVAQPGQEVAAAWRNANHLDLFMTDVNGQVVSIFFEGSAWQPAWFGVAPGSGRTTPGQPVTAVWRNPGHLDLFMTDVSGQVSSTYFDGNAWAPGWFPIAPATGHVARGQPVTAVWSNANHLDLFIATPEGRVLSTYFDHDRWLGSWFEI